MFVIGLTGGIASGKTTISNLFQKNGVPIIDTDIISRTLLNVGQPGYKKVVRKIGPSILLEDRSINRQKLRQLVFSDVTLKSWLESMLHPLIYSSVENKIVQNNNANYVIVVIPLLFEANFKTLVDRILVVDCPQQIQIKRLIARDGIDESLANSMLNQQWSNDARLECADDVIQNTGHEDLEMQVQELHNNYLILADNQ